MKQPAHTASALSMTVSSSSSSSTSKAPPSSTGGKNNWRGKYLRALNISAPEVDVVARKKHHPASVNTSSQQLGQHQLAQQHQLAHRNNNNSFSRSFNTSTDRDGDEFQAARAQRHHVPQTARYSHRRALAPREQLIHTSRNGEYGFALKPDLARGRRCHTDPVSAGESTVSDKAMASAPIQIPIAREVYSVGGKLSELTGDDGATMLNNNLYKSSRKSPASRSSNKLVSKSNQDVLVGNLLSWEEPAAMLTGVSTSGLGGLDLAFSGLQPTGGLNNGSNSGDLVCDEFVETDDEEEEDDDDDEIFEMEDFDSDSSNNNLPSSTTSSKSKSRRRRTASASQATTESSDARSAAALPRYHSVRQMRAHGMPSSPAMELPESFVPPHQLIQRDCFSIGLRDEFKRRQQPKI